MDSIIDLLASTYGIPAAIVLVILAILSVWFAAHLHTQPGTQIRVFFGLVEYTRKLGSSRIRGGKKDRNLSAEADFVFQGFLPEGAEKFRHLGRHLSSNRLADGDRAIGNALAMRVVQIGPVEEGKSLFTEATYGKHVFLILSGKLAILVGGDEVASLKGKDFVGEFPLLLGPLTRHSVGTRASADFWFAIIPFESFDEVGNAHPGVWRNMAAELAGRLLERNEDLKREQEKRES